MSLLTPLYVLGLLAVSAPLIFHLIRRSPKGEMLFSSLMFLSPSPPRLTRRSRLDNILLLLLRAAALCLLAFAFARPFLREAAGVDRETTAARRVAILIDTSASMRRGDLWDRAMARVDEVLSSARPEDELGVFAFDSNMRTIVGFEELGQTPIDQRPAVIRQRLAALSPSWGATHLDQALIDTVAAVNDAVDNSEEASHRERRIVLISDLQQGSRVEQLNGFDWPNDVKLDDFQPLAMDDANAGMQLLADPVEFAEADATPEMRIRVTNDPGSPFERFLLRWVDKNGNTGERLATNNNATTNDAQGSAAAGDGSRVNPPIEVYCPPGENRVVRVPYPPEFLDAPRLTLGGDRHDFDNTLYVAAKEREDVRVLYIGPDAPEDTSGLQYFLRNAFYDTPQRKVLVTGQMPAEPLRWDPLSPPRLIVVSSELSPENGLLLRDYLAAGGTVVSVLAQPGEAQTLARLAGVPKIESTDAGVSNFAMLTDIAFGHPLFAALSGPQFNDFTKIHFWHYRQLPTEQLEDPAAHPDQEPTVRVLARFEGGDPAVLEKRVGTGHLIVLTAGWHPADSQLARSSKFIPLVAAMLDRRGTEEIDTTTYLVSQRVPLSAGETATSWTVTNPAGDELAVPQGDSYFAQTETPGMYALRSENGDRVFAVNLDPAESRTGVLPLETLEQLRVGTVRQDEAAADPERSRQMRDVELEGRQKVWQWLILAAVGVLLVETWVAGRTGRQIPQADAEA